MTITDEIEFDDDEIVADPDPLDRPAKPGPKDIAARLLARWKTWPWWGKLISVPAAFYAVVIVLTVVFGVLGGLLGIGGSDNKAAPASTDTTSTTIAPDTTDVWQGLPTVAPIVAAVVKPEARAEFRNWVNSMTADGTSICDVFFGVTLERQTDGTMRTRWTVTTPNMQRLNPITAVVLPSSEFPVRAFYGDKDNSVCNVAGQDVLVFPPTTTVATTRVTVSPGE